MSAEGKGFENPAFQNDTPNKRETSVNDVQIRVSDKATPSATASETADKRFGYGKLKPKVLQGCNRMPVFVCWCFILCFVEGVAVNGLANAGIVQIEKQFQLTSTKSALIPSSQDIGALIVVLFVSFVGARYHKPIWVATGSLLMALGSFLFMVPHFAEKYIYKDIPPPSESICKPGTTAGPGPGPSCETSTMERYLSVFVLAQIVHGIGFTPMFTLGTAYIDENEDHATAALYISLTYAAAAIGVAVGFFIGGQFLQKLFVDFESVDPGFDATDPRWIGAWWFGFIFTTILFVLVAIPIYGYPKYMPVKNNTATVYQNEGKGFCTIVKEMFLQFFKSLFKLIKNPVYMFINIGGCCNTLIISGVGAFSFKYLTEEFSMDFDTAGFYIGGLILVGSGGMFLGGLLIKIFHFETTGMLRLNVVVAVVGGLLGLSYMASCPDVPLVGKEVSYINQSAIVGYEDSCQGNCDCKSQGFLPICGADGNVYYSPCHAGCTSQSGPMSFGNCSCISGSTAVQGKCPDNCTSLKILAPCLFLAMFAVLTGVTPSSMATLRCVDEDQRPFALGFQWLLLRLLGTIPGPVLVGWVIDKSCVVWAQGFCGSDGFCMMYGKTDLAIGVMHWWVAVCLCAALFFFIASLFSVRNGQSHKLRDTK